VVRVADVAAMVVTVADVDLEDRQPRSTAGVVAAAATATEVAHRPATATEVAHRPATATVPLLLTVAKLPPMVVHMQPVVPLVDIVMVMPRVEEDVLPPAPSQAMEEGTVLLLQQVGNSTVLQVLREGMKSEEVVRAQEPARVVLARVHMAMPHDRLVAQTDTVRTD